MKTNLLLSAVLIFLFSIPASQAEINCSVSSPGFAVSYTGTLAITQTNFTLNCSRQSGDPSVSTYSIRPNNGLSPSGSQNRSSLVVSRLNYEEYQDSICSTLWRPTGGTGDISGVIDFGGDLGVSEIADFWACIPAGQPYAVGTYTDTVTMTFTYDNGTEDVVDFANHQVSITTIDSCTISSAPANISFTYTAFQNTASNSSSSFGATCSVGTTYSISTDSAGGVISGLNYSLQINTVSSGGSNPLGATGNGVQQNFFINASMPANQSGACTTAGCMDSHSHTLTLSF